LLGLVYDTHPALEDLADDFVMKLVLYGEEGHRTDVDRLAADVKLGFRSAA
jgi:hypothetical protein